MGFSEKIKEIKEQLDIPLLARGEYFSKHYDEINELVRLTGQMHPGLEYTEVKEIAYKQVAQIAYEEGVKTSHGNVMSVKQIGFFLAQVANDRKEKKDGIKKIEARNEEVNTLTADAVSKLTKESIGWTKENFEVVASRYYHEHPAYWPFNKHLQLAIAWLRLEHPDIANKDSEGRSKGDSGWTYGEFYDEFIRAKELRNTKQ